MKSNESEKTKLLWSAKDLMEFAGLTRPTAYQFLNRADMPVVLIGGRKFMNSERFREWINAHTQNAER